MKDSSQYKLSTSGKLAVVISLAYMGAPAFAANIEAVQGGAQVAQKNGVDIVNIVKPNEQGLSHNQFNKYNVSQAGAVLNNALQAGQSQLAGQLGANSNLQGKAASVILNEVVSKNPSLILGQQEIFGMAADYVLANPNGITYNGGTVINAPRTSLVVGTPDVVNGKLESFTVGANGSNAALNVKGDAGAVSILDLVAPRVIVNAGAKVQAKDAVNVVSGSNKVGYANNTVEKLAQTNNAPVLDGQIFGSMKAGSIRIHSTDNRATQSLSNANIQADNLATDVAGKLHVTKSKLAAKDIALNAKDTVIDGQVTTTGNDRPVTQEGWSATEHRVRVKNTKTHSSQTYEGSNINATNSLKLSNTGNVQITGATIQAGSLDIDANNISANNVVTTNKSSEVNRRYKGLWHNQKTDVAETQTVHRTDIKVAGNASVNASGSLNLQGTALNAGQDVKLSGAKGVNLTGNVTTNKTESEVDVRNESGKLKTGKASNVSVTQTFTATEIKAGGDLGLNATDGTISAMGSKIAVDGNAVVSSNKVNFGTTKTNTSSTVDDKFKYWGGLAGGAEDGQTRTRENLQATSLTAKGDLLIGAKEGVNISGSTVKGNKSASVNAGNGTLNITAAKTSNSESQHKRRGTIFNITKSRLKKNQQTEVVTGSTLASDTNLQLVSDKNVNVLGSALKAAEKLGIKTAGNLNIATVAAHSTSSEQSTSIKGFAEGSTKVDASIQKPVAEATGGVGIRFSKTTTTTETNKHTGSDLNADSIDLQSGATATLSGSQLNAQKDVTVTAKNITTEAVQDTVKTDTKARVTDVGIKATAGVTNFDPKVSIRIGVDSGFVEVDNTKGTAAVSGISGENVTLQANKNIQHEGTNIKATGDLTQKATQITQTAAKNTDNTTTTEHSGGIFVGASASVGSGFKANAGIYGKGGKTVAESTQAVATNLSGNNVTVAAANIADVGTNYAANKDVKIDATNKYTNEAATDTANSVANHGGADLTATIGTKDFTGAKVNVALGINYSHNKQASTKAQIGHINAENVNITSQQNLDLASNINASNEVNLTSKDGSVNLNQSNDTSNSTKANANLGIGVTVDVIKPAVSSVNGNVNVDYANAKANTGHAGVITTSGNVNVTANAEKDVNINGASIISKGNVTLTGADVNSQAITHSHEKTNVSVGLNANVSKGWVDKEEQVTKEKEIQYQVTNACGCTHTVTETVQTTETVVTSKNVVTGAGAGVNVAVSREQGVSHTANQLVAKTKDTVGKTENSFDSEGNLVIQTGEATKGEGLKINAGKGINLTGTNVTAEQTILNAKNGDINLGSAEGSLKRTGAGVGLGLDANLANGFKPTGGSLNIDVDTAKNKTYTGSGVNTNNLTINTNKDLNLTSSTITAGNVSGKVEGGLNATAQQNVTNEVAVNLGIQGAKGLNPNEIKPKDAPSVLVNDLQNGTILGHKAGFNLGIDVDKSKKTQATGITSNHLNLDVAKNTSLQAANIQYGEGSGLGNSQVNDLGQNIDSSKKVDFGMDISTNVPKMVDYGIQHAKTGTSPLFHNSSSKGVTQVVATSVTQTPTTVAPVVIE